MTPKNSNRELLRLINEFHKVAGYNINCFLTYRPALCFKASQVKKKHFIHTYVHAYTYIHVTVRVYLKYSMAYKRGISSVMWKMRHRLLAEPCLLYFAIRRGL